MNNSVSILDTEEYSVSYYIQNGGVFLHCDVFKWSKEVYQKMLTDWAYILEVFKKNDIKKLYALIPQEHKLFKFSTAFGFEPVYLTSTGSFILEQEL